MCVCRICGGCLPRVSCRLLGNMERNNKLVLSSESGVGSVGEMMMMAR